MSTNNDNDDNERTTCSCNGLQQSIDRLLQRYEKRKQKDVPEAVRRKASYLVKHLQYLLTTLSQKRTSLQTLLQYITNEWKNVTNTGGSSSATTTGKGKSQLEEYPLQILSYFVQLFLRCQDGLVLLTSGECRHVGDIQQHNNSKKKSSSSEFPSLLSTLEKRNDGYTSLYRSDLIYSGYGFDEFINEHVGIQSRLCNLLAPFGFSSNKERVWEYLVTHGGEIIESYLDEHERHMKDYQQQLASIKSTMLHSINTILHPQKVTFITQDKIERLVIVLNNSGTNKQILKLERRGNQFQIHDKLGVLPITNRSIDDWKQSIPLPALALVAPPSLSSKKKSGNQTNSGNNTGKEKVSSSSSSSANPSSQQQLKKRNRLVIEDSSSDDNSNDERDMDGNQTKKHKILPRTKDQPTKSKGGAATTLDRSRRGDGRGGGVAAAGDGGLVVKVEQVINSTNETEESVTTIRTQMGMNVKGLETSREELEQEQQNGDSGAGTRGTTYETNHKAATDEEKDAIFQERQTELMINRGKQKVQRLSSILKQVQSRSIVDDNEVWDARECLRQAYMAVGNDLLWSSTSTSSSNLSGSSQSSTRLEEALKYFGHASKLVQEQQESQVQQGRGTNDLSTIESRYVQRNLLLLRGQADVNRGIVLVEWSQLKETKLAATNKYHNQAKQELQSAQNHAIDMRRHAKQDQEQFGKSSVVDWIDCMVDILKADQLESLTSRWMGVTLWHSYQRTVRQSNPQHACQKQKTDAVVAFDRASNFFFTHQFQSTKLQQHPNLLQSLLDVGAECIYGCSMLADLACSDMEQLGVRKGPNSIDLSTEHSKGDELLTIVQNALQKQAGICDALEAIKSKGQLLASAVSIFQEENEIPNGEGIRQSLLDIETWWSTTKSQQLKARELLSSTAAASTTRTSVDHHFLRGDLFAHGESTASNNSQRPTRRFVVIEGGMNRSKKRKKWDATGQSNDARYRRPGGPDDALHALDFDNDEDENNNNGNQKPIVRYRKWGDELLPQVVINEETGEMGPKLVYPAVAPEMPPDIRAIFEKQQDTST